MRTPPPHPSLRRNLRDCLLLQVAQGLIWVWGENSLNAGLESAVTPAPLIPELDDVEGIESGRVNTGAVYQRDLPYAWETFMENVLVRTVVSSFSRAMTPNRG